MVNTEQVEKEDFNALVAWCAGSEDRKGQEEYLAKVVMELMIDRLGKGNRFPDEKVLELIKADCEGDVKAPLQINDRLFPLYIAVAKALLDDADYDLFDIRLDAIKFLRQKEPRTFNFDRKVSI